MSPRLRWSVAGVIAAAVIESAAGPAAAAAPSFRVPTPVFRTLPNGLTVAVFEDDRLALVQMQFLIPAGSVHEPAGEAGVAHLTFQALGQGTASRTVAAFDGAVQGLGGSVGGSVSREFTTVNGAFLAADLEAGLELLADAIVNPLFDEERLLATKGQMVGGLAGARQDPALLADEHLWAAVFRKHPYGRPPHGAPRALNALGAAEVRAFHRQRYRPDRALLAIAGDVTPERAFKAAEDLLSSWGGRAREIPAAILPGADPGWRVRIVDAPGLARAQLRLGALGPARREPDHDALTLAGELMGSGSEPGLRVGATGLRDAGLFSLAWSAPVDSAAAAVDRMRAMVAGATSAAPGSAALEGAKRRHQAGFTFQFDTRGGLIAQWMAAVIYSDAGERLGEHPGVIDALTADAVRAALARQISPDRLVLVAVGPADRLRPQLERFGPVEVVPAEAAFEVVDLPSSAATPPTPSQVAQGRALVAQSAAAHGGLERLRGIKDSSLEGDVIMAPGARQHTGRILQVRKDPDRFLFSLTVSVLKSTQVMNGDRAWLQAGDASTDVEDLDSLSAVGLRTAYRSDLRRLLLTAVEAGSRVSWRGRERRDERDTDVIEVVSAAGVRQVLFLDGETRRLVAMEQHDAGHVVRRLYRDHRNIDGVLWPFSEERLLDGQRTMIFAFNRVSFNTGVKDALFLRPGSGPATGPASRPRVR